MIVVSGPKSSEPQVRTALASQGYTVLKTVHDHRFPPDESGQPEAFVTVLADEDQLDSCGRVRSDPRLPAPSTPRHTRGDAVGVHVGGHAA